MRYLITLFAIVPFLAGTAIAQEKKAPAKIVFEAKNGAVTFNHASHSKLEKEDCKACHPKLFPQSRAPINFKSPMHKVAEANKTSCAACHREGGTAFAVKGNCTKCHAKPGAAKKG
jgi:c(7)-type cytochrome triheme protein